MDFNVCLPLLSRYGFFCRGDTLGFFVVFYHFSIPLPLYCTYIMQTHPVFPSISLDSIMGIRLIHGCAAKLPISKDITPNMMNPRLCRAAKDIIVFCRIAAKYPLGQPPVGGQSKKDFLLFGNMLRLKNILAAAALL